MFISTRPAWFNKLVLMDETNLDKVFEKMDIDKLNQKLEENMQEIFRKPEVIFI